MSVDLAGAADLHCHFGPDPHRARSVDAFEAAREAAAAGHRAIVLKSHDSPTASLAWAVHATSATRSPVFGGICCDREVGGVNPAAVEVALDLGARIVWLPTLSSRQDFENGVAAQLGIPGPGIVVIDDDGELLPETKEVLALVREHDAILATGHVSAAEHYAVTKAIARRARRAHARHRGPRRARSSPPRSVASWPTSAWVELCAMTCIGALATKTVGRDGRDDPRRRRRARDAWAPTSARRRIRIPPRACRPTPTHCSPKASPKPRSGRMACTNPTALLGLE